MTTAHLSEDLPCNLLNAAWHADPYPFYAELRAQHRARDGLFFDAQARLWVACTAPAVQAALQAPALSVRPQDEPVPRALQGRPSGHVFGGLMRMNDDAARHDLPKQQAGPFLEGLLQAADARAEEATAAVDVSARNANDAIFDGPLALMAALLGVPPAQLSGIAREVRDLVAGWAANAGEATRAQADAAAVALLARFGGDANRVGFLTQTCDATAGLLGAALRAWQRDPAIALDAESLAAIALRDAPVQNTRRFAAGPAALCGQQLASGDTVLVLLASANHDEGAEPHGWGRGRHACPGERLSRAIAAALLRCWLAEDAAGWRHATARWRYRPLPNARIPEFLR